METKKTDDEENDSSSTSSKNCSSTTTSTTSTMENLSRDDLIKKCKGLLNIAQKAKQAKDAYSEESNKLKEQLTKYQTQKLADKTALKTMQEVIDSLTQTKLIATGKITDLESENNSIKSKLKTISDQLKIENESLKRQNIRLTEENDDLLNDLQNLEYKLRKVNEMGLEQNKDLIILEKETDKWKNFQEIVDNLNEKIKKIEIENDRLKNENEYIDKERNDIIIKYGNLTDENHKVSILNSEFIEKLNKYENLQIANEQKKNESIFNYENLIELEEQINALSFEHKNAIKNILKKASIDEENINVDSLQEVIEKLNEKLKLLQVECDAIKFENEKQILLVEKTLDEHMHLQKEHNLSNELNNNLTIENNIIRQKFEQLELLNINVSKTVETLESDKKCLAEDNSKLINQTDHQQQKLKLYKLKLLEFSQKLKQLKSTKEILLNTVKEYSEALPKWQREILTVSKIIYEKLTELEKSNSELAMQLNDIQEKHNLLQINCDTKIKEIEYLKEVQFKYNDLLTDHERLLLEMNEQNDIIKKYETNNIQNLENLNFKSENEILHKKIDELLCKNDELQNDDNLLESILNDNCQKMDELQNKLISYDEKINIMNKFNAEMIDKKTHEYNELLGEMREINEAFKNRGDIISKQQQQFIELQNENALNGATKQNAFDEIIKQKDTEIERLLISLKELEQKCNNAVNNIDSETLSISTISRVEDVARMRDIEDSFEEKYNKLRALAVKLKKKVTDQNAIIANYELKNQQNVTNPVNGVAATTTNDNNTLKNQLKNLQSIQKENDRITDELEQLKNENKNIKKLNDELKLNYDKCTTDLRESKNKNDDIKNEVNVNSKTKATLDQAIKEYLKQIQLLKTENDKLNLTKKDLEIEFDQLKSNLLNKESELHLQKDEINKLHNDLTKIKATAKKSEILTLEMEAYEKSLKDVSQKLEIKNNQNREYESTIKNLENTLTGLKNQILILDENLESEKLHSIDLKQQIDMQHLRLRESDHEKLELKIKVNEMEKEKNTIKLEIDDLRLDTSQTVSEKEKVCLLLRTENETILRNKFNMEDEINTLTLKLRNIEKELVDTKTEFANYKIRAQNVLRQNQTKETSREMELEEELNTANIAIENAESKLKLLTEHNKQLQQNYDDIKDDKNRLHERYKELLQLLDESRTLTEIAQDDNRRQMQEQQEILKTQRLHMETVNNCYKKQLNELEENHRKELTELKKINTIMLRQSEDDEYRNRIITSVVGTSSGMEQYVAMTNRNTYPIPTTDEQKIDWILMERQDGEGSENTNSVLQQQQQQQQRKISSTRNRRDLIPLDELLNTSFDDNQNQSTSSSVSVQPLRLSPTVELQQTKDKLNVQESRVKHLTVLLAEAEQDLAKLTQLNEVLKEEVRRHERSLERQPHMHNLEYLKNVIFKFLTINNGDEKSHLVPVLNTILKLSPEETQKLQAVAKGGDGAQRGWGNYLPIWSNHQ